MRFACVRDHIRLVELINETATKFIMALQVVTPSSQPCHAMMQFSFYLEPSDHIKQREADFFFFLDRQLFSNLSSHQRMSLFLASIGADKSFVDMWLKSNSDESAFVLCFHYHPTGLDAEQVSPVPILWRSRKRDAADSVN